MDELARLLDEGLRFDAQYGGSLSNHRPMALVALARLGAPPSRLTQWATQYDTRLRAAPAPVAWPAGEPWPPRLGDVQAWPAYRSFFAEWLDQEGVAGVLTPALPQLMQGCGGGLFHGLIRVAYAVQSAHRAELADALAYLACRWEPVAEGDTPADVDEQTLSQLAHAAAEFYARSGDFIALHLVTSAHAVRVLLPHMAEPEQALAAVAAYQRALAPARLRIAIQPSAWPARTLPWRQIVERAIADEDEHVIKLVDSCREQHVAYGGAVWQRAATRAVTASN